MFNKLKQVKELRQQAKSLQNVLSQESTTVEKGGVSVTMNGNLELTAIKINPDLALGSAEGMLIEAINEATKKTQRLMADKMQEMGGLPQMP